MVGSKFGAYSQARGDPLWARHGLRKPASSAQRALPRARIELRGRQEGAWLSPAIKGPIDKRDGRGAEKIEGLGKKRGGPLGSVLTVKSIGCTRPARRSDWEDICACR